MSLGWAGLMMALKCMCWGFTNIFPTLFEWGVEEDTPLTENLGGMPFQCFGITCQGSSDSGCHFRYSKRVVRKGSCQGAESPRGEAGERK